MTILYMSLCNASMSDVRSISVGESRLVPVLYEVLLLAQRAGCLTARNFGHTCERVALGTWPRELLEMREVLHHHPFFLCRYWAAADFVHEVENSLSVLSLAAVVFVLVDPKVSHVQKVGIAELARQGTASDGRARKGAQRVAWDVLPGHVRSATRTAGAGCLHLLHVLLDLGARLQRWVSDVPLVTVHAPLELSCPHAVAEHEQVLLQAIPGVTSESIPWIRRSLCFCKTAVLSGSKLRKLSFLSSRQESRLSDFPEPVAQVAFASLGL